MYCHGDNLKWENCKETFRKLVPKIKLDKGRVKQTQLEMHHWQESVKKMLESEDHSFAVDVSKQILDSCLNDIGYGDLWYYVQPIVRLLFQKHAEHIWPLFSEIIRDADSLKRFRIMHLLNSGSSFEKRKPSVLSELPEGLLEEWCLQNPFVAPEFIARTTDILLDHKGRYVVSSIVMFLINNFGNNECVLSALSSNLSSFGWSGSLVPYLEKEIEVLETIKDHKIIEVRDWVRGRIVYLRERIERESLRDEEHDLGVY